MRALAAIALQGCRDMTCSFCGRRRAVEELPRGWESRLGLVLCGRCRRKHYHLRHLTLTVAESASDQWREFRAALDAELAQKQEFLIHDPAWKLTNEQGQPRIHVSVADRWWTLRLRCTTWPPGRRAVFARIASGNAVAGDLILSLRTVGGPHLHENVVCRTVAWLPRERTGSCAI